MQILHTQSSTCSQISRTRHAVLTVEFRKNHLSHIRSTSHQRPIFQIDRQLIPHSLHNLKDRLRSLTRMRHLESKCSRSADRSQEKPPRNPGRDAHLPGLQHNVLSSPTLFKPSLRRIRYQSLYTAITIAHAQPICCGPYGQRTIVVHLTRNLQQALCIILHVSSHPGADRPPARRAAMEDRRLVLFPLQDPFNRVGESRSSAHPSGYSGTT